MDNDTLAKELEESMSKILKRLDFANPVFLREGATAFGMLFNAYRELKKGKSDG